MPDSDDVLSIALAAHEIGHLSKIDQGNEENIRLDNFEATKNEEERAWRVGKMYLMKHLDTYYKDGTTLHNVSLRIDQVKSIFMDIVDWSKPMYLDDRSLDGLNESQKIHIIKEQREAFYKREEVNWKKFVQQLKETKIGKQIDWNKFIIKVKGAVLNIIKDNRLELSDKGFI